MSIFCLCPCQQILVLSLNAVITIPWSTELTTTMSWLQILSYPLTQKNTSSNIYDALHGHYCSCIFMYTCPQGAHKCIPQPTAQTAAVILPRSSRRSQEYMNHRRTLRCSPSGIFQIFSRDIVLSMRRRNDPLAAPAAPTMSRI